MSRRFRNSAVAVAVATFSVAGPALAADSVASASPVVTSPAVPSHLGYGTDNTPWG